MAETQPSGLPCPSAPTHDESSQTPTVKAMSCALRRARRALSLNEYLQPSGKITQLRQGSLYWNDNGDCLAVDEDPRKGVVDTWPKQKWDGRTEKLKYSAPQHKLTS